MQVNRGLFKLDLVDHHAVLGVPLDADAKQVRKRYLKIARKLHPDSLRDASDTQKQQASELLSKLVNPAYEVLSQEKSSVEHKLSLKLKGQQLQKQPTLLPFSADLPKKVASSNNVDYEYSNALKPLIAEQYESLEEVFDAIGAISELNAAYVMRQGGAPKTTQESVTSPSTTTETSRNEATESAAGRGMSQRERRVQLIDSFINRAKEFEYKGNFSRGIIELREALKSHPQNARCHAELGRLYMRSNQLKLASIHTNRSLELDPDSKIANDVKKRLDAYAKRMAKKSSSTVASTSAGKSANQPTGRSGGLLNSLRNLLTVIRNWFVRLFAKQ